MIARTSKALSAFVITFLSSSAAVQAVDLETVLAGQANLTTFRGLVKVRETSDHCPCSGFDLP
jgi:hypothetical protein